MKVVKTLDKKKHRNDLWMDSTGALWFWNWDKEDWYTLQPIYAPDALNFGFYVVGTDELPGDDWPDGPFTRVVKGYRE